MPEMIGTIIWSVGLIIVALILIFGSLFTVRQKTLAIVERFGRFIKIARPGLNTKIPLIDKVVRRLPLRIRELDVKVETKTKDNVFVLIKVSVQYYILENKAYDAFYKLSDPTNQIESYVFDVVRATVPRIKLDEVFEKKDEIAQAVKKELLETMDNFGYGITQTLVTDIDPNAKVKAAMNEINAATRLRIAATEKGEAEKILQVKAAEAEAESKALQGKGIADQRRAIINGLRESVKEFQDEVEGTSAGDVMRLVMMTQYFDTLKEVIGNEGTTTVMLPHSPAGLSSIYQQINEAMISSDSVSHNEVKV